LYGGLITGLSLATNHWLLITDHFHQRGAIVPTKKKDPSPRKKQEKTAPVKKQTTKPGTKATKAAPAKKTAVAKKSSPNKQDFPIVGIGSSAGGLAALEKFFDKMPPDAGMAFVVVTHLDPSHASMMASLLQKHTEMKVVQVEDGMKVAPNQVYVIPPDKDMGIVKGRLQLMQVKVEPGPRAPVNYFLRHLAEEKREKAACIILSGMGTDGTLGLKAIKGELGMVMVQDPETAKYDGMPRSAISTGLVDYILPPDEMPESLLEYTKRTIQRGPPEPPPMETVAGKTLQKIHMVLRSGTGHDFSSYKENTIIRRIQRRMNVHHLDRITDYLSFLQQNPQEVRALFKELLIGVTSFFRDPEAFEVLKDKALMEILKDKPPHYTVRMWVPGCATGEEAYSLAILLQECMEALKQDLSIQIFATDIDNDAVEKARMGIYPGDISADVGQERLRRFFDREKDSYRVSRKIRDTIIFAPQSVIKDPPFTKLDLICCRNLLIYLDSELQKRLMPLFHYSLNQDGILFLGSSETIGGFADLFSPVDTKWKIYRRKPVSPSVRKLIEFPLMPHLKAERDRAPKPAGPDLPHVVERQLLEDHTPAAVVVDHKGDVAYIHGRTGKYLEPAPGTIRTINILEMARSGLKLQLPTMLRSAATQRKEVVRCEVPVKQNGQHLKVNVSVQPMKDSEANGLFLVLFEDVSAAVQDETTEKRRKGLKSSDKRIEELEKELKYTSESLRTTIEELETANEELKSTNEEYQSTNEELQSANEELNSSKEELQSLNEELETVNSELQDKNHELTKNINDMKNLLDSMAIPTVFLDNDLRIKRFTAHIGRIINLREADVGRRLDDFMARIKYKDLIKDIGEVLKTLVPKEMETLSEDGRWYLLKIRPYRTIENMIDGLVLTFTDIHALKSSETNLRESRGLRIYFESIVNAIQQPLLVLDKDLKTVTANEAFYTLFNVKSAETKGKPIHELGEKGWDIPELGERLARVISKDDGFEGLKLEHHFPRVGRKQLLLGAQRIKQDDGQFEHMLLTIEDVTDER
jgi:two-component system CheB/CheR fusion protein